jgi:hypothetical protein
MPNQFKIRLIKEFVAESVEENAISLKIRFN